MNEGLALQLELGRLPDAAGDLGDAALAHALRGDLRTAVDLVDRLLKIDRAWTQSAIFPPQPAWAAARVLHQAGDSRTSSTLALAARLADSFGSSIDVPELRASFEALPFVRQIGDAVKRDVWP